ncbi:hypothetical protein Pth03_82350 [Planotetraspora thailandica]|uniref:Uncharacterized protein n=1 Tax=Planotetraspora thailandica TaxID=487172 RepID=A0A8J3Y329_9ACTN|nr:hypothetical protein [Planotetraspora thailandica]GII59846.1 hypothetical protein Pth03_82350 [Planotetraspora thailandica]
MNLRNVFGKVGMTVAVGAVVLTAAPAAIADTTPTPAPAVRKVKTLAEYVRDRDAARKAARDGARGTILICDDVSLTSQANNRHVSAELDYTGNYSGMLRARATSIGDWETFELCYDTDKGYDTLSVDGRRYVSAEIDYSGADAGMLRARSASVGAWEKFDVTCPSYCTIRSLANNKYVSAELAYTGSGYGMLRARSTSVGAWEKFSN